MFYRGFFTRYKAPAGIILMAAALSSCAMTGGTSQQKDKLAAVIDPSLRSAADTAEANFDYKTAAGHYRALYQRHPDDLQIALKLMRVLRYAGSSQQAIELGDHLTAKHGQNAAILAELGKAYLAADRVNIALRYLEEARTKAPADWDVWSAIGVAFDYQQRFEDARQAYEQALSLAPDHPQILNNFGLSRAQAGDLGAAVSLLERAADQPRANAQVRQNLALVMAIKGDVAAAERLARKDLPGEIVRSNVAYYKLLAEAARLN